MSVSTTASNREAIRAWFLDVYSAVVKNGKSCNWGNIMASNSTPTTLDSAISSCACLLAGSEFLEDHAAFIFEWHRICQNWFATYKGIKNETKWERKHSAYIKRWGGSHEKCMRSTSRASGVSKCTINTSYHHHQQQQQPPIFITPKNEITPKQRRHSSQS